MNEAKFFCVQCLSRTNIETIINKLLVFGIYSSFHNPIASIKIIIEKRVADILHVNPDLVCAARFQSAFYQCYIIESFEHTVPSLIRYNGNWKAIFKKRERGVFTATLSDFE